MGSRFSKLGQFSRSCGANSIALRTHLPSEFQRAAPLRFGLRRFGPIDYRARADPDLQRYADPDFDGIGEPEGRGGVQGRAVAHSGSRTHQFRHGDSPKADACKLSPEGQAYFKKMVDLVGTYKFRCMHLGDFLWVWPCDKPSHGHLPGTYSIYAQGQKGIQSNKERHEASPGLRVGADGGFTNPPSVRYEDSRAQGTYCGGYFQGDPFPAVEPDLHLDRLYAEVRKGGSPAGMPNGQPSREASRYSRERRMPGHSSVLQQGH